MELVIEFLFIQHPNHIVACNQAVSFVRKLVLVSSWSQIVWRDIFWWQKSMEWMTWIRCDPTEELVVSCLAYSAQCWRVVFVEVDFDSPPEE